MGSSHVAAALRRTVVPLLLVLTAALVVPGAAGAARGGGDGRLQEALDAFVAAGVPGAVVLARHGREVTRLASGEADTATHRAVRPRDRFRVGSITKTFTATVVLQLAGEGRLSLDDSVEDWLPGLVPGGDAITIRQLLNHTSGLFSYTEDVEATFGPYLAGDLDYVWAPRDLVAIAVSHPPVSAPGEVVSYNNTGYVLLGLITEAVTGQPLRNELRRRILDPLKLRHTSLPSHARISRPHAHGYSAALSETGELEDITGLSPSWGWAAGALVSTARDVARFYRALLRGRVLSPDLLAQMQTTNSLGLPGEDYGLGLWHTHGFLISNDYGIQPELQLSCGGAWGHDGDLPGYHADAFVRDDGRRQVVLLGSLADEEFTPAAAAAQFRVLETALCG